MDRRYRCPEQEEYWVYVHAGTDAPVLLDSAGPPSQYNYWYCDAPEFPWALHNLSLEPYGSLGLFACESSPSGACLALSFWSDGETVDGEWVDRTGQHHFLVHPPMIVSTVYIGDTTIAEGTFEAESPDTGLTLHGTFRVCVADELTLQ